MQLEWGQVYVTERVDATPPPHVLLLMNFSDLGKMKEMMTQAREMQAQMEQKLAETIVEAETGGGMVKSA